MSQIDTATPTDTSRSLLVSKVALDVTICTVGSTSWKPCRTSQITTPTGDQSSVADPNMHSIFPLDPDLASECGSRSSYKNVDAKSRKLP
jgi:hypothetical protein